MTSSYESARTDRKINTAISLACVLAIVGVVVWSQFYFQGLAAERRVALADEVKDTYGVVLTDGQVDALNIRKAATLVAEVDGIRTKLEGTITDDGHPILTVDGAELPVQN